MCMKDTIAAISTPLGESGVGVIRLSGSEAISVVDGVFKSKSKRKLGELPSHKASYGWVIDPGDRSIVDDAVVVVMKAPHSYTTEDMVEVSCHGGVVVLRRVLSLFLDAGARLAEPGEFTKRAFLNGRLDLAQAEAVIDVIKSRTEASLQVASRQLAGGLSEKVGKLREELINILAQLEAAVDFSDEDVEPLSMEGLGSKAQKVLCEIDNLLKSAEAGKVYREGLRTVIVGRPNVGKSSLLNALLRERRAIVTSVPGTTRDVIEEIVSVKGIPLKLRDTAGIRPPSDEVEELGVQLSWDSLKEADLVLYVIDASEELTAEDFELMGKIRDKKTVVVINKTDLPERADEAVIQGKLRFERLVKVSATKRVGVEDLEEAIVDLVFSGKAISLDQTVVTNVRHQEALRKARNNLEEAAKALQQALPEEMVAIVLKDCLNNLGEIVGETVSEDILEKIFSQFCIGK